MAESLNAEQLEERRTNLRAFRDLLEMEDDSELNTTLLMQEEWLATIDELQNRYARLLDTHDNVTLPELYKADRDAHMLRGLRTQKCLDADWRNDCEDFLGAVKDYCAPCYLRAIHKPSVPFHGDEPPFPGPAKSTLTPVDDRPECEVAGHIWVKMGKVGLDDHGLSAMDWGETKCLRCNEPYDVGFDTE